MTWVSFENFQFWGSRENWLLRQHGRNFVAGADNTALCSGNLCKFVQLVGICANIYANCGTGTTLNFSSTLHVVFIASSVYESLTIIPKRTHSMIYLAKCANNGIEARWILFAR